MKPQRELNFESKDQIKQHEAIRLFAYPDPASPLAIKTQKLRLPWGKKPALKLIQTLPAELQVLSGSPWTIGAGHTRGVKPEDQIDMETVLRFLDEDLDEAQLAVERLVKVPLNDCEYGALVSLVFNIGTGNFAKSTLLRELNAGNYQAAAYHFGDWIKVKDRATGKLVRNDGLYNRRQKEKAFFLSGADTASASSSPVESVAEESKPAHQDTNITVPSATGIGAVGVALSEGASKVEALTTYSETIKIIFICLTVAGVIISLYLANRKRKENR